MRAGTHEGPATAFHDVGARLKVCHILSHEMVEEPSFNRTVSSSNEMLSETADVKSANGFLASEAPIQKLDIGIWVVREQIHHLTLSWGG